MTQIKINVKKNYINIFEVIFKTMPNYEYKCNKCEMIFETNLKIADVDYPETQTCPECGAEKSLHWWLSSAPAIGDPIKLGITRPPDAFLHGILGRMQNSVPDGGVEKGPDGHIKLDSTGKPRRKYVNFNNKRYSPGRLI